MRIVIGADHNGLKLKNTLASYLREKGADVTDAGIYTEDPVDYPDTRDAQHDGVIHIPGHLVYRIIQPLAPDVELRAEIQFPFRNGRIYTH